MGSKPTNKPESPCAICGTYGHFTHNHPEEPEYRLWVNGFSTVLVRLWKSGTVEVATRENSDHTWGPPVLCDEEKV